MSRFNADDIDQFPAHIRAQLQHWHDVATAKPAKSMRRREQELQIACVEWADTALFPGDFYVQHPNEFAPPTKIGEYLHHTPNGGGRSRAEGGIFKAMGVRAGYPDLSLDIAIARPGLLFVGFRCELKADEDQGLRDNQRARLDQLARTGHFCCTATSVDGFRNQVLTYLGFGEPIVRAGAW